MAGEKVTFFLQQVMYEGVILSGTETNNIFGHLPKDHVAVRSNDGKIFALVHNRDVYRKEKSLWK